MKTLALLLFLRMFWAPDQSGLFVGRVDATLDGQSRQTYVILELANGKHKMVPESKVTRVDHVEVK